MPAESATALLRIHMQKLVQIVLFQQRDRDLCRYVFFPLDTPAGSLAR